MPERSAIPFNIRLLDLTPARLQNIRPVTSLEFFDGNSQNFHPEGLFSTLIFGRVGDEKRSLRFSYIDIRVPVFHPVIWRALTSLKQLYKDVIAGTQYAVWNEESKDFDRSDALNGQTGFHFFVSHWKDIQFAESKSDERQAKLQLLQKYRDRAMTSRIVVMPAGMRDLEFSDDGRIREDETNTIYRSIIARSNSVNENTVKRNPELIDTVRYSLQTTFNQLYDHLESMVEGKHKLLLGKWASRRIFDGTRNVVTAMDASQGYLGSPGAIGLNDHVAGLYQTLKAARPLAVYHIRTGFLQSVFPGPNVPARLVNTKTLETEPVQLKPEYYDRWATIEGVEKLLTLFGEESLRHRVIEIDGRYLGLIYKGPDMTFRLMNGIDELPGDLDRRFDRKHVFPLTFCELLYCSTYRHMNKVAAFLTRYPITGLGSVVPGKIHMRTTIRNEVRRELGADWTPLGEDYVAHEFPVRGGEFINSIVVAPALLGELGMDFDGDTGSLNLAYTDDSIAEVNAFLKSRKAYIGPDGRPLKSCAVSTVNLVLHNMTGDA
ncbi:hypothetical protein [Paraburkholderia adhaesiva]|uniref:hypothetical protein n=1 Tax=Paraburkholderia adhaesiva TaxID=2883244 RepID=UPI001F17B9FC|nr:hypothetical protein [Paraburkholderia adhaesiva]